MPTNDVTEIVDILNRYAFAVDTLQWDLFDAIFTPDVHADYLGYCWENLESWKCDFAAQHEVLVTSQHTVTNHQVIVNGDRANALSYAHARLIREFTEGGENFWECGAWYDDVLVRTFAGWRIERRACRVNWSYGNPRVSGASRDGSPRAAPTAMRDMAASGRILYLDAMRSR